MGQLEQVAQEHVQFGFDCLQGQGRHSLSEQPASVFATLTVRKRFFLRFKWNFVSFSLCPLPLGHSLGTAERSQAPSFVCAHMDTVTLSLLFAGLNSPSSRSLSLYDRCFNPCIIFMSLHQTHSNMSLSLLNWGAQHWTQHSRCISPLLSRGGGSPLDLLATLM